jgi:tetratricopeptide (TPR) repeat protein
MAESVGGSNNPSSQAIACVNLYRPNTGSFWVYQGDSVQSGGLALNSPLDWSVDPDFRSRTPQPELVLERGMPLYLRTLDGSYHVLGSHLAADPREFWRRLDRQFKLVPLPGRRGSPRLSVFVTFPRTASRLRARYLPNASPMQPRSLPGGTEIMSGRIDLPVELMSKLYVDDAVALLRAGNHMAAIALLERARKIDPASPAPYCQLAAIFLALQGNDSAAAIAQAGLANAPGDTSLRLMLAQALTSLGRLGEALVHYESLLLEGAYSEPLLLAMARAFAASGDLDSAIAVYRTAAALYPKLWSPYLGLAGCLSDQQRPFEAIRYYQKAVAIYPTSAPLRTELAFALASVGRYQAAIPHFHKAILLDPENAELRRAAATIYQALGQHAQALPHLEHASRLMPLDSAVASALGCTYRQLGDIDGALRSFRRALEINPGDEQATVQMAECYLAIPNVRAARDLLRAALEANPSSLLLKQKLALTAGGPASKPPSPTP